MVQYSSNIFLFKMLVYFHVNSVDNCNFHKLNSFKLIQMDMFMITMTNSIPS